MEFSKQEKDFINAMLYGLLNDKEVNEWEHDFIKSIAEREQVTFTDKQRDKLKAINAKCTGYEYGRLLGLVLDVENT